MSDRRSPSSPRVATFLVCETLSAIGTFATMIAIWAYAAYRYDASPGQIALYGVAFTLPGFLLGPLAGVVVDRVGQRGALIGAKVLGVAASLALLSAHSFGALTILSALHGVSNAFARPAFGSLAPRMVDDEYLARTNALLGLTEQLSLVFGPVFAGVAIGLFGFKGAFVFDAFTYALGIVVLPLVALAPVDRATHEREHPFREAADGWRIVASTPVARRVVVANATVHLLYGTAMLAEPLYVRDVLHESPSVFASLQSVFGILLVAGGIVAARRGERMARPAWVIAGVIGSGASAVIYLGTPWVGIAFVGVAIWGLFTGVIGGPATTVLQRATPEAVHGRVMATDLLASSGALFVGLALGGMLIADVGVRTWIITLGAVVIVFGSVLGVTDRAEARTARAARPVPPSADQPQDAPSVPH